MNRASLVAVSLCAAAGCTSSPTSPIPGANPDAVPGAIAAPLSQINSPPCGYRLVYDVVDPDGSKHESIWNATVMYDGAGRDIAETAVDEHGAVVMHDTTEYDGHGNPVKFDDARPGEPTSTWWLVYDANDHLTRYAGDQSGDGKEDWVATYGYGADGLRVSAHLVLAKTTYDRAYHYGDDGRLIRLDKDVGPDGTIDESTTYQYDDAARVTTRTVTDAAGHVTGNGRSTYDVENRLLHNEQSLRVSADDTWLSTEDHVYAGDKAVSETWSDKDTYADGSSSGTTNDVEWKYDHCQ
jgi:YD repeat-containing protein